MKRLFFSLILFLLLILGLYLLRYPILRGFGNYLIYENELKKADVTFVLSGNGYDRGNEAVKLYKKGLTGEIICTGENKPNIFLALNMEYYESEITRINIIRQGVPKDSVKMIIKGTSTYEESQIIYQYCKSHHIKTCMVLSSKFHTRRIKRLFQPLFKDSPTELIIRGAPSSTYDEQQWWASEDGLISLNNEYIKLMYYLWKY